MNDRRFGARRAPQLSRRALLRAGGTGAVTLAAAARFVPAGETIGLGMVLPHRTAAPTPSRRTAQTRRGIPAPRVVPRRAWGADETRRHGQPIYDARVDKVIVHHTGTPNSIRDAHWQLRQIYEFETSHGYQDIAYHYLIDRNGVIYEGRWARDYAPGETPDAANTDGFLVRGGHAGGHNDRTVGIAFIGDYMTAQPSRTAIDAAVGLVAWLCDRYDIDPRAATPYTADSGATEFLPDICPHGATSSTLCPGTNIIAALPEIRRRVGAQLDHTPAPAGGYRIVSSTGQSAGFGTAPVIRTPVPRGTRLSGLVAGSTRAGCWGYSADGGVFAYGDASFHGSLNPAPHNAPIVGMAATPTGRGYWLAAADGGVFAYGDAAFHGSVAGRRLSAPITGIATAPDGRGYWLLAADGGVFAYGDAAFHGSYAGAALRAPVTRIVASADGYWLVGADGSVFAYGDAVFAGSAASAVMRAPVVAMLPTTTGRGYMLCAADGGTIPFGDAPYLGAAQGLLPDAIGIIGTIPPQ